MGSIFEWQLRQPSGIAAGAGWVAEDTVFGVTKKEELALVETMIATPTVSAKMIANLSFGVPLRGFIRQLQAIQTMTTTLTQSLSLPHWKRVGERA
jgi:hypothetical protein